MREALLDRLGLKCPRCRRADSGEVASHALRHAETFAEEQGSVLEGLLECANPRCRARYPILRGVPVVVADLAGWWRENVARFAGPPAFTPGLRTLVADLERGRTRLADREEPVGVHMRAHYPDQDLTSRVPEGVPAPGRFWARLGELAEPEGSARFGAALDAGCSVGRFTFELARISDIAVGMDLSFPSVERAAAIAHGATTLKGRFQLGPRHDDRAGGQAIPSNVIFLVADALDPPFAAARFDFVAAIDLLDSVRLPLVLLGQLDALLAVGGRLLLTSPYTWRSDITAPEEWLESASVPPGEFVRGILAGRMLPELGLRYSIESEDTGLPRVLPEQERKWTIFVTDAIRARKRPSEAGAHPYAAA